MTTYVQTPGFSYYAMSAKKSAFTAANAVRTAIGSFFKQQDAKRSVRHMNEHLLKDVGLNHMVADYRAQQNYYRQIITNTGW